MKNDKFHLQENLWSDGTEPTCIHQPHKIPIPIPIHKISIEVSQPVLGLHIFRNFTEEKVNMAPLNMSKSGPMIPHFCRFYSLWVQ